VGQDTESKTEFHESCAGGSGKEGDVSDGGKHLWEAGTDEKTPRKTTKSKGKKGAQALYMWGLSKAQKRNSTKEELAVEGKKGVGEKESEDKCDRKKGGRLSLRGTTKVHLVQQQTGGRKRERVKKTGGCNVGRCIVQREKCTKVPNKSDDEA